MRTVDDLMAYLWASPSPYHAVDEAARRLAASGFVERDAADAWVDAPASAFVRRGGALVAWVAGAGVDGDPAASFRIVGAHTDSPNLRLKPQPDTGGFGWKQLAVEVYGGALWNSWLDRDLGLSGRVATDRGTVLVRTDQPLLRVPQLAIHLDRDVNGQGLKLNPQQHLTPVWGLGTPTPGELAAFVVELVQEATGDPGDVAVRGWDLMLHDLTPPARLGRQGELLASARLDNQVSCWAGLEALTSAPDAGNVAVVCLYDHEEVGSTSATGADGALLAQVLERIVLARGGGREDVLRALSGSVCLSVDAAHATHPNYPERHEPGHHVRVDGGPVVKVNANQRYATGADSTGVFLEACEQADVPHQWFVSRNDQPCGSTIGPLTAGRLGVPTIDVGVAQLSMHSARELCGADDPLRMVDAMAAFFGIAHR